MESKDQIDASSKQASTINIDINGETNDESIVKNMSLDSNNEARVGLSKDELMKYANQPFWVRLRNILFASFWIVWLSILFAAIGYVVNSPGCTLASAASANATTVSPPASGGSSSG